MQNHNFSDLPTREEFYWLVKNLGPKILHSLVLTRMSYWRVPMVLNLNPLI